MQATSHRSVECVVRVNPNFLLVPLSELNTDEVTRLRQFELSYDLCGILRPQLSSMPLLAVDRQTFDLFTSLRGDEGCPVSLFLGPPKPDPLVALIMDQVFEIANDGHFLSGPAAFNWLYPNATPYQVSGRIGQLSRAALQYADMLKLSNVQALSHRIYSYNRLPITADWKRNVPHLEAIFALWDIEAGSPTRRLLESDWLYFDQDSYWLRYAAAKLALSRSSPFKLYISPLPLHCGRALRQALSILTEMEAPAFKISRTLTGVLRPDKFVAYFENLNHMHQVADRLGRALENIAAQGVPFTVAYDKTGLLSWAIDPPNSQSLRLGERLSWRRWITDRLAQAILTAQSAPSPQCEPWHFAEQRMVVTGVDPATWSPVKLHWALNPT